MPLAYRLSRIFRNFVLSHCKKQRTMVKEKSDIVKESAKTTKLHKLVVIYRGIEMVMCEELTEE